MALLTAKLVVTCPRSESTVEVMKACQECGSFKHVVWQGLRPLIVCTYTKPEEKGIKRW